MPELPEVETVLRSLRDNLFGRQILDIEVYPRGLSNIFPSDCTEIKKRLQYKRFTSFSRVGKWLVIQCQDQNILCHLRMSGRFITSYDDITPAHLSIRIKTDGPFVYFVDQRRFGRFEVMDDEGKSRRLANIGVDAVEAIDHLQRIIQSTKFLHKPIYSTLMDQSVIAGIGNIYANEILFASEVHPLASTKKLTIMHWEKILSNARRILLLAIEMKGTTLDDNLYQDSNGQKGGYAELLKIYGKKNDPNIEVFKVSGRSVYSHKSIQKLI